MTQIENVLDAAISARANSIYGLTFGVMDAAAAESQARAAELAALVGATVGDVVAIDESALTFPHELGILKRQSRL